MKYSLLSFLVVFSLAIFSCGPTNTPATETPSEEAASTEEPQGAPAPAEEPTEPAADGDYTIKVLTPDLPSPRKEMTCNIDDLAIKINYGSPAVRGRAIWGDLEPLDEVWRTGANEATSFEVNKDITVGGQELPAGKYGLFTIPSEGEWTVIFNSTWDQWGAYEYDAAKDVARFKVPAATTEDVKEQLDFLAEGNIVKIRWEKIEVPIVVEQVN